MVYIIRLCEKQKLEFVCDYILYPDLLSANRFQSTGVGQAGVHYKRHQRAKNIADWQFESVRGCVYYKKNIIITVYNK